MGEWVRKLIPSEFAKSATLTTTVDRGEDLALLRSVDVVIDFSSPEATLALARDWSSFKSPALPGLVVGSTGWKLDDRKALEALSDRSAILMASNFSPGVLAFLTALKEFSPLMERLGYTPVIVETHHSHKQDAPSGTALSLQRAISSAGPGNIQTHSIRAGEVIGDHEVTFYGAGDQIKIAHSAQDRSIFARGAIEAAIWLSGQAPSGNLIGMETFFKERYQ